MKYDFTSIIDRHGKDAIAVDACGAMPGLTPDVPKDGFDFIPMWVADMNYPTCPSIISALSERIAHPAFGYFFPSDAYYDGIIRWQTTRNNVTGLTKEHIGYENGVLGCVISALNALTLPGEAILLHSPTYVGFTFSIDPMGRKIVLSDLKEDENGIWRMDYEDMEAKIRENKIHVAVFCSPHNPCGRVWEREELEKAMEVFERNEVTVISDEIWSDIILPGHTHIPTQSVSEYARNHTVAVYAPSKTFNLAGLVGSYHIIYSSYLRDRVDKASSLTHYNMMNVLSMHALIGAYQDEGYDWLDELCQTIDGNVDFACNYIRANFKGVHLSRPQGTYMLYLDCEDWCFTHGKSLDELLKSGWDVGVGWQDGRPFHRAYAIRMNLALPLSRVEEAMYRLNQYVFNA